MTRNLLQDDFCTSSKMGSCDHLINQLSCGLQATSWLASARTCSTLRGAKVLELGAGVGVASIAAAVCGAQVLATDNAVRSLALIEANAAMNGVSLRTGLFDWHNDQQLAQIRSAGPFDYIIGASLRFEEWWSRLWQSLGLLSETRTKIILVHTTDGITPPLQFQLLERTSGDAFGMARPDRGEGNDHSDFEVVVMQKATS